METPDPMGKKALTVPREPRVLRVRKASKVSKALMAHQALKVRKDLKGPLDQPVKLAPRAKLARTVHRGSVVPRGTMVSPVTQGFPDPKGRQALMDPKAPRGNKALLVRPGKLVIRVRLEQPGNRAIWDHKDRTVSKATPVCLVQRAPRAPREPPVTREPQELLANPDQMRRLLLRPPNRMSWWLYQQRAVAHSFWCRSSR